MMVSNVIKLATIFLIIGLSSNHLATSDELIEVCQTQELRANCSRDEVVLMTQARYGRMKLTRCIERDYGYMGCATDVIRESDYLCSGRRSCSIGVPNSLYEDIKSQDCPKDLKSYLQASFQCLPVYSGIKHHCSQNNFLLISNTTSGYLSSVLTEETDKGSFRCPWLVEVPKGQRINVTLWDFGDPLVYKPGSCQAYAVLRETSSTQSPLTVCGGSERVRHVLETSTNRVEIRLQKTKRLRHFLIHYQAIGCPDPAEDQWNWFNRISPDRMTVGCTKEPVADEHLTLHCNGSHWVGAVTSCKGVTGSLSKYRESAVIGKSIHFGTSIFAITTIAIVFSIFILIFGLVILRCRNKRQRLPTSSTHPTAVYETGGKISTQTKILRHPEQFQRPGNFIYNQSEEWTEDNIYSYIPEISDSKPVLDQKMRSDYGTNASGKGGSGRNDADPKWHTHSNPRNTLDNRQRCASEIHGNHSIQCNSKVDSTRRANNKFFTDTLGRETVYGLGMSGGDTLTRPLDFKYPPDVAVDSCAMSSFCHQIYLTDTGIEPHDPLVRNQALYDTAACDEFSDELERLPAPPKPPHLLMHNMDDMQQNISYFQLEPGQLQQREVC